MTQPTDDFKVCTTCHTPKLLTEFNKDRSRTGGLSNRCRECAHKSFAKPNYLKVKIQKYTGPGAAYEVYDPGKDRTPYRNDGNKHIKSFGTRC